MLFRSVFSKYINPTGDKEVVKQIAENPNAPNPNFSAENQLKVNISKCIDQFNLTEDQCKEMYDPQIMQARNDQLEQTTRNHMDNIVFDYKKSSNSGNDFFEELLELIYYNSIDGILESSLLKLIIGCEALYKFNPYDVITILKHYGYLIWGYRNGYKSIKYWPKSISFKKN